MTTTLRTVAQRLLILCFCLIGTLLSAQPLYQNHWSAPTDPTFSGSGGTVLTQIIDANCSMVTLSVTDPVNAPVPAFSPMILNPQAVGGGELTDLSGNMSFHVRVKSRDTVRLAMQLRSGGGSAAERTDRLEITVNGDTAAWTEHTFVFSASQFNSFDSTDLRDVWFYLDRGTDNFAGDEFIFDYFSIGETPDSSTWSTCPEDSMPPSDPAVTYAIHYTRSTDPIFSGSAAGTLTQTIDSACSQLFLSVADPVNAPWSGTSPIIINPKDSAGNDIADLSGSMQFHLRVRSKDTVDLALLLRSGDGTSAFRTDRVSQQIPGDTLMWTELTYTFDVGTIGGFDSMDLRDIWLYLDYGDDNFNGNAFWVDYFAFGEKPSSATHSGCSLIPPFEFPWILHWADTVDQLTSGSSAVLLTQTLDTTCSQLRLEVTSPILEPHEAFKPIRLDPLDENGFDITDLSGQLRLYTRVRSADAVELSILLRSGEGTSGERTEIVTQTVPAGLDQWTDLIFDFSGANLSGFDSTDLRDIFMYLDRSLPNWPGNEFYFDYVSVGSPPDATGNSTCVETVSISEPEVPLFTLMPNPVNKGETVEIQLSELSPAEVELSMMTLSGQTLLSTREKPQSGQLQLVMPDVPFGMYLIRIQTDTGSLTRKIVLR